MINEQLNKIINALYAGYCYKYRHHLIMDIDKEWNQVHDKMERIRKIGWEYIHNIYNVSGLSVYARYSDVKKSDDVWNNYHASKKEYTNK